jgi:uncharacterized protein (DUF885 family)
MRDTPADRARSIASEYVRAYYERFPEEAAGSGYPHAPMDRLSDLSADACGRWEAREDDWLARLATIDPASLAGSEAAVPYAVTRERLEASVERRAYHPDLWNVSAAWGWPFALPLVFARQPVGNAKARADALARASDVPRYIDTEVENLREGLRRGFAATYENAREVLSQVESLIETSPEASPFYEPALRDHDRDFARDLREVVRGGIRAALERYRDFLRDEYRARNGGAPGLAGLPCGAEAYRAAVRYHVALTPDAGTIHATGLDRMERIHNEMRDVARRGFGSDDVPALLQRLRSDPRFTFRSADEILTYTEAAVERARAALPAWFARIPRAAVVVRPFPAFQKRTGGGLYSAAAEDGSYPATYELGTHDPGALSRAAIEATAFHETWPGHHLQISLAMESDGLHPVLRYLFSSGFIEGWALYTERLADEMGLYSSDLDRLGMLSNEALRAARLVVDPGLHALGWSREAAIRYMLDHTAESEAAATYEVDRYIAGPGQAVGYLLGRIEIDRLRAEAERRLGARFDVRAFHDCVLKNGSATLPVVRDEVEAWLGEAA